MDVKWTPPQSDYEAVARMAQDGDADPVGTARLNYPHLFPDWAEIAAAMEAARDYVSDVADGECFFFATKMRNERIQKMAKDDLEKIDAIIAKARGETK